MLFLSELLELDDEAIAEIHDSELNGISLPKLSVSEDVITSLKNQWNKDVVYPNRGVYKNYIEQTIRRYAQDRQGWKKKYRVD